MHAIDEAIARLALQRQLAPPDPIMPANAARLSRQVDVQAPEDLGPLYEQTLEADSQKRKAQGSFYTPRPIVQHVLDHTLEPIIARSLDSATDERDAEHRLLALRICDPACGGGVFLHAALVSLTEHILRIRSGPPASVCEARQCAELVARTCIFGVDLDPIACALARITLWLTVASPDLSVDDLTNSIRNGNALLGSTKRLVTKGIPNSAYTKLDGDDTAVLARLRSRNKHERDQLAKTSPLTRVSLDRWTLAFLLPKDGSADVPTTGDLYDGSSCANAEASLTSSFIHWEHDFPAVFTRADDGSVGFDVVLGNPPFLNQLKAGTTLTRREAELIRARTNGAAKGYADAASIFLTLSMDLINDQGRVGFILPTSTLSSRDASGARMRSLQRGSLVHLWISQGQAFDNASTYTCCPVVDAAEDEGTITRAVGVPPHAVSSTQHQPVEDDSWGPIAAGSLGVPEPLFESGSTLGAVAEATADFRDEYYGLKGAVVESESERDHPLLTSGLVDPANCLWGKAQARIHKARWALPAARLGNEHSLAKWAERRLQPKVILATQTKVLEVFVDDTGKYLPLTPLISISLQTSTLKSLTLWHIATALSSPVCTAHSLQQSFGSALSVNAIKVSAKQTLSLPLPADQYAWDLSANLFMQAQSAPNAADRNTLLLESGQEAIAAYRVRREDRDELFDWWRSRLPIREDDDRTPLRSP